MAFDYSKLSGRIVEKFGTRLKFASKIGMKESTLIRKLNNQSSFKDSEIWEICEKLKLKKNKIPEYFFSQ